MGGGSHGVFSIHYQQHVMLDPWALMARRPTCGFTNRHGDSPTDTPRTVTSQPTQVQCVAAPQLTRLPNAAAPRSTECRHVSYRQSTCLITGLCVSLVSTTDSRISLTSTTNSRVRPVSPTRDEGTHASPLIFARVTFTSTMTCLDSSSPM